MSSFQNHFLSKVIFLSFIIAAGISLPVQAQIIDLSASLDNAQEIPTPTVTSPGSGSATMTYDDATNLLSWDISFSGLSSATAAAHFHGPAAAGMTAPVEVDIATTAGFTSPQIGSATLTAAQEADLLAGLWYINIHTANNAPGEIRGQVINITATIPTLQEWAMIILALLLLAGGFWQIRRQPSLRSR